MIGGLWKSTSTVALAAAAGLFVSGVAMPSAKAADLGGDCCADLEERVAELEATTARKGNRRVSLTITGQVHKAITFWDDGHNSGTYFGLDNTNSSSRFSFLGEARISPKWKAGFEIMIETEGPGRTAGANQLNEDGLTSSTTYFGAANGTNNAGNSDGFFGDARRAAGWIEHADFGRITLGRWETAGAVGTIDLGGVGVATGFGGVSLTNAGFFLRNSNGDFLATTWGTFLDPSAYQSRQEVLRYDSPTWAGFVFSASISEAAGDFTDTNWGVMLRYAGDFSGFRVAAGIGYDHSGDAATASSRDAAGNINPVVAPPLNAASPDINAWGAALSVMHVASGLFLQGSYQAVEFDTSTGSGYWGDTAANKQDADWWQIQGGIAKNWFGIGNTVLYGEYARLNDWGAGLGTGRDFNATATGTLSGFFAVNDVTSSEATVWGIGIVQNIDAAATELYLGYRNFSLDLNNGADCDGVACNIEDMHLVTGGMRIRF
jgi:hypothetical protein